MSRKRKILIRLFYRKRITFKKKQINKQNTQVSFQKEKTQKYDFNNLEKIKIQGIYQEPISLKKEIMQRFIERGKS